MKFTTGGIAMKFLSGKENKKCKSRLCLFEVPKNIENCIFFAEISFFLKILCDYITMKFFSVLEFA